MTEQEMDNKNQVPFVQLRKQYLTNMRSLIMKSPISASILLFFIDNMSKKTNSVICSYQTLIELTGYSRSTISRSIKFLKDDNWIDTVKIGSATAYCVNEKVAWQSGNNQRRFAVFSAIVIATETEQEKNFREKLIKNQLSHTPLTNIDLYRKENSELFFNGDSLNIKNISEYEQQIDIEDQMNN